MLKLQKKNNGNRQKTVKKHYLYVSSWDWLNLASKFGKFKKGNTLFYEGPILEESKCSLILYSLKSIFLQLFKKVLNNFDTSLKSTLLNAWISVKIVASNQKTGRF